ncbi:MAG: class I SAM-dependent methyltransferase [Labilithrix sp.]
MRKVLPVIALGAIACSGTHQPQHPEPPHAETHPTGHHAHHHGFKNAAEWAKVFDDPARDEWQRPDEVLRAMELTPAMTVADIGAGTGYFSVRLARAVSSGKVIGTDIEPDMVHYLNERATREHLTNLSAAQGTASASGLGAASVDRILVVDVWHHLDDRVAYARDLATALRPGGAVFVVDFKLSARQGPPPAMRLPPEKIVADLAAAGLTARVSAVDLPEQYIVEARRP